MTYTLHFQLHSHHTLDLKKKKKEKKKSNYFVLNNNNNNLGVALPFEKLLQCIKITLKFKCNIFLGTLQQKKATEMLILQIKIFKNS